MSLTAYRKSRLDLQFDYDGGPVPIGIVSLIQRGIQASQEFQLSSPSRGRFTWLTGAYYFFAEDAYDPANITSTSAPVMIHQIGHEKTSALAGFAQGTYKIFDSTDLTLGGRYSSEKRTSYDTITTVFVIPVAITEPFPTPDQERTFSRFTYRASLDQHFTDNLLGYVSCSTGFKSGGFNIALVGAPSYAQETIAATELGIKGDFFDRRVRANAALFYDDYKNIQVHRLVNGALDVYNGAAARIYGLDTDFTVIVTADFKISGALGWISPRFTDFPDCSTSVPLGNVPPSDQSCAGNLLPLASKVVANLNANYTVPLPGGTLDLNTNAYYNSGFYEESDDVVQQPQYWQLGAYVKYTAANGLYVSAFGKNLTDKRVLEFETTGPSGSHLADFAAPRTYGINLGYKF
jgi:iron complex outermembrane receptor protein